MMKRNRIWIGALALLMALPGSVNMVGCMKTGQPVQVKAASISESSTLDGWNIANEVTVKDAQTTYHAYLSEDGKAAWIYLAEITDKITKLNFPDEINGAAVTRLGYDPALRKLEEADEFNQNIAGVTVEFAHGCDGANDKVIQITSVHLPEKLTTLEATALSGLGKMKSIVIPDGVTKINAETFYGCKSLQTVKLPKSMEAFENYTSFAACPKLSKVTLSRENKNFKMQNGMLLNKKGTKLIWALPKKKKIVVPDSVTTIAENALKSGNATSVYLGKKVKKLEKSAIAGKKITKITLSKKNRALARQGQCIYERKSGRLVAAIAKKKVLKVGNKVKWINGDASLCGSRRLKKLYLAASVKTLQGRWGEFYEAGYSTTKVYFYSKKPPKLIENDDKNYCYLPIFADVYVPKASLAKYKKWYRDNDALKFVTLKTF